MIQYRRLAALLVGAWLGASILADVAVTQNFQTVDRFLDTPGSVGASVALREISRDHARFILRRNAAEENNWIFLNWERVELSLGGVLFLMLVFGERPQRLLIVLCGVMFLIVAAEHFLLTPLITDLGRKVDDLPATDPVSRKFWILHGVYSGLDILKMLVALAFAVRLAIKRKPDPNQFVREYAASLPVGAAVSQEISNQEICSVDNRRMCPHCRAFIASGDRTCAYCGQQVGPRAIERRQPGEIMGGLIPHAHFTTILILVINFGFFLGTLALERTMGESGAIGALGAKFGPYIFQEHEYWRLVTAGFLHGGWLHILMNSWVLYDLGAQVEQVYGTPRFLALYFAGTVGGFYLSAIENPLVPSVGSSAGIMGLIGAMIAFGVVNRSTIGRAIRNFYGRWVIYIIAFGLIPGFSVDNWAHIGGLAAGFAIGYVAGTPVHSTPAREAMWRVIAATCVLITVWCFFMIYRNFPAPNQLR